MTAACTPGDEIDLEQPPEVIERWIEQACFAQMEHDYGNCGPGQILSWSCPLQILLGCVKSLNDDYERADALQALASIVKWLQGTVRSTSLDRRILEAIRQRPRTLAELAMAIPDVPLNEIRRVMLRFSRSGRITTVCGSQSTIWIARGGAS
jgi:hypothetical protein